MSLIAVVVDSFARNPLTPLHAKTVSGNFTMIATVSFDENVVSVINPLLLKYEFALSKNSPYRASLHLDLLENWRHFSCVGCAICPANQNEPFANKLQPTSAN